MQKRSAALAAVFALSMGLAACGDDDGGSGYALSDVCDEQVGLYIDFFETAFACQPEFEIFFGSLPTAAELSIACEEQFAPYLDDGTVFLSQAQADWDACLAFISGIDCETFGFDGANPCDVVFQGQLLQDEECDDDLQCDGDSFCDDSDGLACGTCQPRLLVNDACISDEECSSRLCADDGTCQEFGLVGDFCANDNECSGLLVCDLVLEECITEPVWAENDACDGQDIPNQCGFPLTDWYCHPVNNVCTAYLEVGETCGQGAGFCRIFDYESCENGGQNVDDTCVAPVIVSEGGACDFQTGEKCADGLVCYDDGSGGTCVSPAIAGDACTDECPGNLLLSCSEDSSTCVYNDNYTGLCPAPAE